jgi:hypothetical protein
MCDAASLLALPQLMAQGRYDLLVLMPRASDNWFNSGVLVSRREAVERSGWAEAWLRAFLSLDEFGNQQYLLRVSNGRGGGLAVPTRCD